MLYNGFSETEIKYQWAVYLKSGEGGLNKKNFMVLKNPDGTLSNTCVKVAWGFGNGSLSDEYAWMHVVQDRAQDLVLKKKLRVPIPIGIFEGKNEQYLVMEFTGNVRTIRDIMQETNGPLDDVRADKLAAAHAALRQAMGTPKDGLVGVTPFKSTEGWLVRGFIFSDLWSNRWVETINDFVGYLERGFEAAGVIFPSPTPITWNHGDPSSYNWGECDDGVPFLCDFGRSAYGPWWIDGHAIALCDTADFTEPMCKAYKKYGIAIEEDVLLRIESFRAWHSSYGYSFDKYDA